MASPGEQEQGPAIPLYPEIEPYNSGWLRVSDLHELYYEESGNPDGNPVIFLHGGPGAGCFPKYRQLFDPAVYRIVLFDQRGCGKSRPNAELRDNTTWSSVADMERLRSHLSISRWVVFGGSWGSTLALAYAQTHPDVVKALVLRGIFTLRREEIQFFYQEGSSYLFPDIWESFIKPIPEVERGDLVGAYYRRLTGDDEKVKMECARAWALWEVNTLRLIPNQELIKTRAGNDKWLLQFARIECHYFVHGGWFDSNSQLLDNVELIRHIPCTIIQGRYDVVTPMKTAWDLHKKWPEAEFHIVPDAGHSYSEPGILQKLMETTEKYKNI